MPYASQPARSKVVVLGDTEVGKTTLTSRFVHPEERTSDDYVATIGIDFSAKAVKLPGGGSIRLQLWDTAGAERYRKLSTHYLQDAAAVLVVYDRSQRRTFDSVREWCSLVKETFGCKAHPLIVLVGNKTDLQSCAVTSQEGKDLATELGAQSFFETSAKEGRNIDALFESLASSLAGVPSPTLVGAPSDTFVEPQAQEEHAPKRCRLSEICHACLPF